MEDTIKLRGCLEITLRNAQNGEVVQSIRKENTIVTTGRRWVLEQICSDLSTVNQSINFIGVGTSTTAAATGDSALGSESTRKAIGTFTTANLTSNPPSWRAEVSFATNEANTTLGEVGLFNSSASGTMLGRAVFSTINKTTSNTLTISYTVSN
jgi:hypothetical protein